MAEEEWRLDGPAASRVVVAGAGYAGLAAFIALQEALRTRRSNLWRGIGRLRPTAFSLSLVNDRPVHVFTTELHRLAAGGLPPQRVSLPLRQIVRPPAELIVARVERAEAVAGRLILDRGRSVPYDLCLLALGSQAEYWGLSGVAENALVLGNVDEAMALADRLRSLLASRERPRIVVAGGGLTGVEVTGELVDRFGSRLELSLIEAADRIMGEMSEPLAAAAERELVDRGVTVRVRSPIAAVEPGAVRLADGQLIPADLVVWAGGVRASEAVEASGLPVDRRGRGEVDERLRSTGAPEIYLAGDCACARHPDTGQALPPTAQLAVQAGRHAARNILLRLAGKAEMPFRPRIRGAFASLGAASGVGSIGRDEFYGLPALVVKRLIEARYQMEVGGVLSVLRRLLLPSVPTGRRFRRAVQAPWR